MIGNQGSAIPLSIPEKRIKNIPKFSIFNFSLQEGCPSSFCKVILGFFLQFCIFNSASSPAFSQLQFVNFLMSSASQLEQNEKE